MARPSQGIQFNRACDLLLECRGKAVCTGIGKSGHLAQNLGATLSSLGTPAFFLHAGEAAHGDMGTLAVGDVLLALSKSGTTDELLTLLPVARERGVPVIAITGEPESPLARQSTVVLDIGRHDASDEQPFGASPMASAVATMALGHALAAAVAAARNYSRADFLRNHPGGTIGRKLSQRHHDHEQERAAA
eukprot:tig00020553_g10618.t1